LVSDAAGRVGEIEPDFYAAEVGAFGANGSGDAGAEVAGRADVASEFGLNGAKLRDFVHGGVVDLFLGVEARAHGPFVEQVEERAGFDETNRLGVGEEIKSDFGGNAAVQQLVFGGPSVVHGAAVDFAGARIPRKELWCDVVGITGIGESEKRARTGDHAVTLILAVRGVADFLGKGVR